jgi:hypothetical protein
MNSSAPPKSMVSNHQQPNNNHNNGFFITQKGEKMYSIQLIEPKTRLISFVGLK